jgi:uncharacterized membrane protein YdjX (TVP38/TMEM64 family)
MIVTACLALFFVDSLALSSLIDGAQQTFFLPGSLEGFVEGFGVFSPLLFLLIQSTQVVAGPVPAGPVIVAGSVAFGFWKGLALSMAGIVVGSVCAFLLGRRFGRPLLRRLVGEELLARYPETPSSSDGWWLFMVLLLPVPAGGDAACALAGLSGISLRRFVLVVAVGRLPGTTLAAFVGTGLVSGQVVAPVAAGLVALVVLGITIRYRRNLEAWLVRRSPEQDVPESKRPDQDAGTRRHRSARAFSSDRTPRETSERSPYSEGQVNGGRFAEEASPVKERTVCPGFPAVLQREVLFLQPQGRLPSREPLLPVEPPAPERGVAEIVEDRDPRSTAWRTGQAGWRGASQRGAASSTTPTWLSGETHPIKRREEQP